MSPTLDEARTDDRVERRKVRSFAPAVLLVVTGLALLPGYRYHIGIDGISYVSLARYYAEGELGLAVSAYWSPLLPWLTAPLAWLGVPLIPAAKVVALASGALALEALRRLHRAAGTRPGSALVVNMALVPFLLNAVFLGVFADLVLAAVLAGYLVVVLGEMPDGVRRAGARAGLLGGVAFLSKAIALPFVLAHQTARLAWRVLRRQPLRPAFALACLGGLALVVGVWVGVLSAHEGRPTWSTAASHNLALVAPESKGNPIQFGGLFAPPHEEAVSVWEDPSRLPVVEQPWLDHSLPAILRRVGQNARRNALETWRTLAAEVPALALLGLGALWLPARVEAGSRRRVAERAALAGALFAAGHLVLWVEPRYLWFPVLCLAPLAGVALDAARRRRGAFPAVALLLVLGTGWPAAEGLALRWRSGERLHATGEAVAAVLPLDGRRVASADYWQRSAILCLQLGCRY